MHLIEGCIRYRVMELALQQGEEYVREIVDRFFLTWCRPTSAYRGVEVLRLKIYVWSIMRWPRTSSWRRTDWTGPSRQFALRPAVSRRPYLCLSSCSIFPELFGALLKPGGWTSSTDARGRRNESTHCVFWAMGASSARPVFATKPPAGFNTWGQGQGGVNWDTMRPRYEYTVDQIYDQTLNILGIYILWTWRFYGSNWLYLYSILFGIYAVL